LAAILAAFGAWLPGVIAANADDQTATVVPGLQPLRADPEAVELGFLRPGQPGSASVTLTNASSEPVVVAAVQPTCSCTTTSDLAGRMIPPGGTLNFDATLAGGEVPGPKRATIKVVIEGAPRPLDIEVRAEVSEAVRAVPNAIRPPPVGPAEGRIVLESLDQRPFTVISSDRREPRFIGFDPRRMHPDSLYVVRTDLGSRAPGAHPALWLIETDREDCPVIAVRVRDESTVVPAVLRLPEYAFGLGALRPGEIREVALPLNEPLEGDVMVEGGEPCALRSLGCVPEGTRWKLRVEVTAPDRASGAFLSEARIRAGEREQRLPVYGTVRGEPAAPAAAQR
jgi:hypothetical protein